MKEDNLGAIDLCYTATVEMWSISFIPPDRRCFFFLCAGGFFFLKGWKYD